MLGRMSRDTYHHGDLKAVILAEAAALVAERGADGISLRELARAAGVSTLVVQQVLPPLVVAGLVERSPDGWRLTPLGMGRPARPA